MKGKEGLRTLEALMACLFCLQAGDKAKIVDGMPGDKAETGESADFRKLKRGGKGAAVIAENMLLELGVDGW